MNHLLSQRPVSVSPCDRRRTHGQSLVEFALVMPILLALVLSLIALWPILNAGDAVAMAAASGAHEAAITGGNEPRTSQRVQENLAAAGLGITQPAVVTVSCTDCPRYQPVTVSVAVPVEPWLDLFWLPDAVTIDATYTRASEVDGGGSSGGPITIPEDSIPDLPGSGGTNLQPGPWLPPGAGGDQ